MPVASGPRLNAMTSRAPTESVPGPKSSIGGPPTARTRSVEDLDDVPGIGPAKSSSSASW
jgi:hypothetical protein